MAAPQRRREVLTGRVVADMTTYWLLSRMCLTATKLWNTAVYRSREVWSATGRLPGYSLEKQLTDSPWYGRLNGHTSRRVIRQVNEAYHSWFRLRGKDPNANVPGFRPREESSPVTFEAGSFRFRQDGILLLSLGQSMRREFGYPFKFLALRVSWWRPLQGRVVEVRIVPRNGYFEAHAVEVLPEPKWREVGGVRAIDLGVINPVTITEEDGQTQIYKGGELLSIIRYWNKEMGRVQSKLMKRTEGKKTWSKTLSEMILKKSRQVDHAINCLTDTIADDCERDGTKEVVVGDLKWMKRYLETKSGKPRSTKARQKVNQFPIMGIVSQLRYKLARRSIRLIEFDERGTSRGRCSVCGCEDKGKLHRLQRGLFFCDSCGITTNADMNGARNILWKYLHELGNVPSEGSSGALAAPRIRRWDGHNWVVV